MARRRPVYHPPGPSKAQTLCYCKVGHGGHHWKRLSTCPLDAPVPFVRRVFHIRVTAGNLADGLMCGIEPGRDVLDMPLGRARKRAHDPGNLWDLCPGCCDALGIDQNGDDLPED